MSYVRKIRKKRNRGSILLGVLLFIVFIANKIFYWQVIEHISSLEQNSLLKGYIVDRLEYLIINDLLSNFSSNNLSGKFELNNFCIEEIEKYSKKIVKNEKYINDILQECYTYSYKYKIIFLAKLQKKNIYQILLFRNNILLEKKKYFFCI